MTYHRYEIGQLVAGWKEPMICGLLKIGAFNVHWHEKGGHKPKYRIRSIGIGKWNIWGYAV